MTTTANTKIEFRSKFSKLLNNENGSTITKAFESFCNFEPEHAREYLWKLTYDIDVASISLKELNKDFEISLPEEVLSFRNELRYQYAKRYPNFLKVSISDEYQEFFNDLSDKSDPIVAYIVYQHIQSIPTHVDKQYMERILFLLKSENENFYFGGIRSLQFNVAEATYLKPFRVQISNLFQKIYDSEQKYMFTQNDIQAEHSTLETEEIVMEEKEGKSEVEYVETIQPTDDSTAETTTKTEVGSNFKELTPEEVLTNKDIFKRFVDSNDFNILFSIGQLGYDLNEVINKKNKIFNFVKAIEAFNE